MTVEDFRRIALDMEGAEEGSHMGAVDFRVGGRIFATLASQAQGYGNLVLTPEEQASFCQELPEMFVPIAGGWGRMGMTHIILSKPAKTSCEVHSTRPGKGVSPRTPGQKRNARQKHRSPDLVVTIGGQSLLMEGLPKGELA
jgi:hypothetical protein